MLKLISLFLVVSLCFAVAPNYGTGARLQTGSTDIQTPFFPSPGVGDWNEDGKKDLILGATNRIRLYANFGSDSSPKFSGYSNFKADGATIDIYAC